MLGWVMKKLAAIAVGLVASALGGGVQAQWRGRPPPGPPPGYGSVIFGPLNTPGAQVMAASTNATGVQTFAITSGTSNCVSGGVVAMDRRQEVFAEVNFPDLKRDMAAGGGEFLSAFEDLLECEAAVHPKVTRLMQAEYETLVPSESTTADELVSSVHVRISADPDLAGRCRAAGPTSTPPA
jgi:hypothetical protein